MHCTNGTIQQILKKKQEPITNGSTEFICFPNVHMIITFRQSSFHYKSTYIAKYVIVWDKKNYPDFKYLFNFVP